MISLTEGSRFGAADRLTAAFWPRGGELPEPQIIWHDAPAPASVVLAVDDADRATIAFTGFNGLAPRPVIVTRTVGSATDAAAAAPHDPRLAPTNCTSPPGPPTPIADEPVPPAPRMRVDRRVRLVHGALVVSVECPPAPADGCSGSVAVSAPRARYARSANVAADRGQWRNLRLPTTARLRRAAKRTRLPVRVAVTSMLAGHESTVTRRKATL